MDFEAFQEVFVDISFFSSCIQVKDLSYGPPKSAPRLGGESSIRELLAEHLAPLRGSTAAELKGNIQDPIGLFMTFRPFSQCFDGFSFFFLGFVRSQGDVHPMFILFSSCLAVFGRTSGSTSSMSPRLGSPCSSGSPWNVRDGRFHELFMPFSSIFCKKTWAKRLEKAWNAMENPLGGLQLALELKAHSWQVARQADDRK